MLCVLYNFLLLLLKENLFFYNDFKDSKVHLENVMMLGYYMIK